jgi:tetratricopeptide (TPR) repeat protein
MPGENALPPGPLRDFIQALHALYDQAGQPPARAISNYIKKELPPRDYETVSHETVSATLRGHPIPSWGKVRSIVTALAGMSVVEQDLDESVPRFNMLWSAARASGPPEPAVPIVPPADLNPRPVVVRPVQVVRHSDEVSPDGSNEPIAGPLPGSPSRFVERGDLLDRMRGSLAGLPGNPLVLYGLIGAGKTRLARAFVDRYRADYSLIWWVDARSVDAAQESMLRLGRELEVRSRDDVADVVDEVKRRLGSYTGSHLVVFDGVEDDAVFEMIPTAGGHVIVTTRDPQWGQEGSSNGLEVVAFSDAEARQFLQQRTDDLTDEHAGRLMRILGRLPLALEQAVAAKTVTAMNWGQWLADVEEDRGELTVVGRPVDYPQTFADVLRVVLDRLRQQRVPAAAAFELFAVLGPGSVSLALFAHGLAGQNQGALSAALRDGMQRGRIVLQLRRVGVVRLQDDARRLQIEPMVRLTLRAILDRDALESARRHVHAVLAAADPGWPDDVGTDMHREIAAHVHPAELVHSRLGPAQETVHRQIRFHYLVGQYADANRLAQQAVMAWREETFLGPDATLVLQATRQWANALRALGRYDQARDLTADGLSRLRSHHDYGDDHPHTFGMSNNHAADLRIAGEYQRALEVCTEIYDNYKTRYGGEDGRTATSRHNLAVSQRLLGSFALAEVNDRLTLQQRRDQRGNEDWRTVLAVNALGEDLYGQGRYHEALRLLRENPAEGAPASEPLDRGRLLAERTVALAHRGLGDVAEALAILNGHYMKCTHLFGPEHEYTLVARMSYANTLRAA